MRRAADASPPVGGSAKFKNYFGAHPRKLGLKRFLAAGKVLARKWVACFWATSLEKIRRRDRAHLVPPNVGWMQQSPAFAGVLSFRSEAREVLGGETARLHHASRRRGGLAALGARAAGGTPGDRLPRDHIA